MNSLNLTPVVKNLLMLNGLFYLAVNILNPSWMEYVGMYYPELPNFRPWQIVTSMFLHFDGRHIFSNMLGLLIAGPTIEALWGPKRFLFYYLFTGVGAIILNTLVAYYQIHILGDLSGFFFLGGASGCIFGLYAAWLMEFPENQLNLIFPPITLKVKQLVPIMLIIEVFQGVKTLSPDLTEIHNNVANFAHLGGALFGILLIIYWRKGGRIGW